MKKLLFVLPLLAIFLVSGCTTGKLTDVPGPQENLNSIDALADKIKTGMTIDEVKAVAGDPGDIQMVSSSLVYFYYSEGSDVLQVAISDGKVAEKRRY